MSTNGCRVSLEEKPYFGSSSDESEDSPGDLVFEYLDAAMPFGREPLTDKAIQTCVPYKIDIIVVLEMSLFHMCMRRRAYLERVLIRSGMLRSKRRGFIIIRQNENGQSSSKSVAPSKKLTLPTFGLVSYKFKMSVWSQESDVEENQRVVALLREAEEWLRRLKVMLPDFRHFVTHSGGSAWR
ncbi:unnamed protein product [Brassica rapa subsp. trilocularis]